jgi:hypothetical protein
VIIAWVELQLMPVKSAAVDTITVRFNDLASFFDLSSRFDATHEYGVAWVDCLARGRNLGRGIYIAAEHAKAHTTLRTRHDTLCVCPSIRLLPIVNGLTTRLFNPLHWRMAPAREQSRTVHHDPYFYPLDRIHDWNRLYGRRGFQQFQCVIPDATAEPGIAALLQAVARSGRASFLTVLKRCGDIPSPGLLSFPVRGISLAIDFPQSARLETGLLPELDRIVHENDGRLYPAKDAHMTARAFSGRLPRVARRRAPARPGVDVGILEAGDSVKRILIIGATSTIAQHCATAVGPRDGARFLLTGRSTSRTSDSTSAWDLAARGASTGAYTHYFEHIWMFWIRRSHDSTISSAFGVPRRAATSS